MERAVRNLDEDQDNTKQDENEERPEGQTPDGGQIAPASVARRSRCAHEERSGRTRLPERLG